jgi:hypothetical protein
LERRLRGSLEHREGGKGSVYIGTHVIESNAPKIFYVEVNHESKQANALLWWVTPPVH